jgi:type I restriction enzyme S subunit
MSWRYKKLGEVCTIEKGNIGITKAVEGEYPLVTLGEERRSHNEYQFDNDAVIIPLVSSTGHGHRSMKRIHFQSGKFAVGSILCAVIPKDKSILSAQFLYRYLDLNKEREFVSRMRGMANVTLPMKEIAEVEIPIPPIEVQEQIVKEFDKVEEANQNISIELEKQLILLKKLRQQIFQDAVRGKLLNQEPIDNPEIEILEVLKKENEQTLQQKKSLKSMPDSGITPEEIPFEIQANMPWRRLGEVCYVEKGNVGIKKSVKGKYPLVALSEERLTHNEYQFDCKGVIVPLISSTGHGHASMKRIHYQEGKFAVGNILCCIYPITENLINEKFLFHYLDIYKHQLFVTKMKGAANVTLKINSIAETPFPLIPLKTQKKFAATIYFLDNIEKCIQQNKRHLQYLLKVALRKAFEPKQNQRKSK